MNGASLSSRGKTPLMLSRPVYAPSAGILRDAARAVGERPEGAGTIPAFGHGFRSAREGGGGGGGGEGHDPKPHYSFHFGINGATRDFCSGIILLYYLIAEGFI